MRESDKPVSVPNKSAPTIKSRPLAPERPTFIREESTPSASP